MADTGQGIPEAIQATIFEPFFTTKPEGQGTGLGLSTVLMVVERHNGRIDLHDRRPVRVPLSGSACPRQRLDPRQATRGVSSARICA